MKIKLHPMVQSASGALGDMVYYELDGQAVARRLGERSKKDPTAAQLAHREKVRKAAYWARATMADPVQKAEYRVKCEGHQTPYNIAVRDFLTAPVIERLDLAAYTGKAGGSVKIKASDDFQVQSVSVVIRDAANNLIEEGSAIRGADPKDWQYTTRVEVAGGSSVQVEVTAMDRPGNKAQQQQWQHLPASAA
jgi:hypothetical protein